MSTKLDSRQTQHIAQLNQLSNTGNTELDNLLESIDKELQPPFRMRQDTGSNRVLYVDDYIVTNAGTNKSHVVTPIDGLLPTLSFPFTITFPAAPAGTITSTITITSGATLPSWTSTHYIKVNIAIDGLGGLFFTYGTAAATIAAAAAPPTTDGAVNIGYIVLQNNAGTISNITNSVIYQYIGSGAGGSGGGAGEINAIITGSSDATGWTSGTSHTGATDTSNSPLSPVVTTAISALSSAAVSLGSQTSTSGVYKTFTLPTGLENKKLKVEFYFTSPAAANGTWAVAVYNATTRVPLSTDSSGDTILPSGVTGKFTAYFDTDSNNSYSVNIVQRTRTNANTLYATSVVVGPGIQPQGAVVGEWQSYTPSAYQGFGTPSNVYLEWRRVGSNLQLQGRFLTGTNTAVEARVQLPPNLTIRTPGGETIPVGTTSADAGATNFPVVLAEDGKQYVTFGRLYLTSTLYTKLNGSDLTAAGSLVAFNNVSIPIAEWAGSGTVNLAQNDVEYASVSGTWDSSTSTTAYGPSGSLMGGALTFARLKTITWQKPVQQGDSIEVDASYDGVSWFQASSNYPRVNDSTGNDDASAGLWIQSQSATQTVVQFNRYANIGNDDTPAVNWPSNVYWRVRKSSAGAAVGFGLADTLSSGLVPSGTYNKSTGAWTLGASGSTVTHTVNGLINVVSASGNPNYYKLDNTVNAGKVWRIGSSGASGGSASSFDIYNQTDNSLIATTTSAGAWTLGPSGYTGTHVAYGSEVRIDEASTVNGTSTLKLRALDGSSVARTGSITMDAASNSNQGLYFSAPVGKLWFYNGAVNSGQVTTTGAWTLGPSSGLTTGHTIQNSSSTTAALIVQNSDTGTTASDGLRVYAGGTSGSAAVLLAADSINSVSQFIVRSNGTIVVRNTNWGTGGTAIGVSSNVLTTSPSSRRYKENETPLSIDSSKIYDIEVKEFDYLESKGGAHDFGPMAEDVEAIIPEIVWKEDGQPESIRESKMVWLILEEMKKLKAELDAAKARIATLEGNS